MAVRTPQRRLSIWVSAKNVVVRQDMKVAEFFSRSNEGRHPIRIGTYGNVNLKWPPPCSSNLAPPPGVLSEERLLA